MTEKEYLNEKNILSDYFQSLTFDDIYCATDGRFNLVSASIKYLLPQLKFPDHKNIFKNLVYYQKISKLDQSFKESIDNCIYEDYTKEIDDSILRKPLIFSTFHMGSYRMINHFLMSKGVPYDLLIAKSLYEQEKDTFLDIFTSNTGKKNKDFNVIDAESNTAIFNILKSLKSGRSLLVYLDGNSGINQNLTSNLNLLNIKLLGKDIAVRKGIGNISYLSGTPILNVISFILPNGKSVLKFHPLIYPSKNCKRDEYSSFVTQELYNQLGILLKTYPEQWEPWFYIHKSFNRINTSIDFTNEIKVSQQKNYYFNVEEFGIYKVLNEYYLFNKDTFLSYSISSDLYNYLAKRICCPQKNDFRNDLLLNDLVNKKVLIN